MRMYICQYCNKAITRMDFDIWVSEGEQTKCIGSLAEFPIWPSHKPYLGGI